MPAIRGSSSVKKTRRHTRDLDQIHSDLHAPNHLQSYLSTKTREDLPALGQYYCKECAKWFESDLNLVKHEKGKPHRRRVKALMSEPYSQKEAEMAVGLGTDNGGKGKRGEGEVEMGEGEEDDVKEG